MLQLTEDGRNETVKIIYELQKLKHKILRFFNLAPLAKVKQQEETRDLHIARAKEEKAKRAALKLELDMLKKKLNTPYPKHRKGLQALSGKTITITGVYIQTDKRGTLIRYVNHNKRDLCDHLWLRDVKDKDFKKGDLVQVKGTVQKYGSMSFSKPLTENYGVFNATMNLLLGETA